MARVSTKTIHTVRHVYLTTMTVLLMWQTQHFILTDLWINLHFFTISAYKHCFLPVLLVFVMKCCIKMSCSLPHNHYCRSLPSPACLPHLLICRCPNSSPIACPPSSVLCWCLLCFFLFFSLFSFGCFLFLFFAVLAAFFFFVYFLVVLDNYYVQGVPK